MVLGKILSEKKESDGINIPVSLLLKIIIGYSVSPTGRKMKLSAQRKRDKHSDGPTDGRKDRQVQNTLEL